MVRPGGISIGKEFPRGSPSTRQKRVTILPARFGAEEPSDRYRPGGSEDAREDSRLFQMY